MKKMSFLLVCILIASGVYATGSSESATGGSGSVDDFPSQPINVIVPFAAGGGMDTTARKLGTLSAKHLGVPLVVVNRTGGGGSIGVTEGSRADADGYTVLFTDIGTLSSVPLTQQVTYSIDSFDGISGLNINYVIIAVNAASPYRTVNDLVKSGTRIRYATVGTGSILHMAMASLFKAAGTQATNIPFQSTAESVAAVMGNHVEAAAAHPNLVQAGLADGTLRIIGVFAERRIASMPEVPTVKEAGYDITLGIYNLILVPKGVPENRRAKLTEGFLAMLNDPEMVRDATNRSLELFTVDGNELMTIARQDVEATKLILKDMGMGR